jgi:hypothetical protein
MARITLVTVAGAVLLTAEFGCGKAPPPPILEVEGVVTLDGKPLKKAQVRFIPQIEFGPEYVASGVTDDLGQFTLLCKGQPGACAGENFVLVSEADIPARLQSETAQAELAKYFQSLGGRPLPRRYANLADSPLTVTVNAGQKKYDFKLTK